MASDPQRNADRPAGQEHLPQLPFASIRVHSRITKKPNLENLQPVDQLERKAGPDARIPNSGKTENRWTTAASRLA
jgi:hypothetical protein